MTVFEAGVSEVIAYLGTPFQVSLGVCNNFDSATNGITSDYYVNWEYTLNSNSAIDQLAPQLGWWAFGYMGVTCLFYGMLAGYVFSMRGTYLFVVYPVVLYGFAELWRLDMFTQGIFYTNLIVTLVGPLVVFFFVRGRPAELENTVWVKQ